MAKSVRLRKEHKSKTGGLTKKGRDKVNRETGSNLKAPVTGKVKRGSKAAKRRKSFVPGCQVLKVLQVKAVS